jgi:hypothetical protein
LAAAVTAASLRVSKEEVKLLEYYPSEIAGKILRFRLRTSMTFLS